MARARPSASTGKRAPAALSRRSLLRAAVLAPCAAAWLPARAAAADYASAAEALDAVDAMEADVAARLAAISAGLVSARPFVSSVLADQASQRSARGLLRQRLGLAAAAHVATAPAAPDLAGLRAAQEALVYAHAEGLPALGDAHAVRVMALHMVELARQLTVIDLWIEAEEQRAADSERRSGRP
jgi:hypothetical protein